jgi:hypothetical protein
VLMRVVYERFLSRRFTVVHDHDSRPGS